jgi:hypothetical protein
MRPRPLAIGAAGLISLAVTGSSFADGRGLKEPKPKLELLTETQEAVLRKDAVKVRVRSERDRAVRIKARLEVDGFPDDFRFRLGPRSRRLRRGEATLMLPLSARQAEVLAFAEQACDGASLRLVAKAGGRTGRLSAPLRTRNCSRG